MEKNKKNEELQSRREFFKKAAKGALPILGAVLAVSTPTVLKAAEMEMGCSSGCMFYCTNSCKGTCENACFHTCGSTCKASCEGGCMSTCYNGCSRQAYA